MRKLSDYYCRTIGDFDNAIMDVDCAYDYIYDDESGDLDIVEYDEEWADNGDSRGVVRYLAHANFPVSVETLEYLIDVYMMGAK